MISPIRRLSLVLYSTLLVSLSACSSTEVSSEQTLKSSANTGIVVTANPHATRAGAEVLRAGGSAVDAAIAIEAVLSLVEPQSSGLAGGGFMVHFDNESHSLSVYDGRETAPMSAHPDMFITDSDERMGYFNAKTSGISTGVPGMVAMLALAHQDHGNLAWGKHFDYAKDLANNGFEVSLRLHGMITRMKNYLPKSADQGPTDAYDYFHLADGQALPAGHLLKSPEYAQALEIIGADPEAFYRGSIAQEIVATTQLQPRASGMNMADLASYKAKRRTVLCSNFRTMKVCGPPPPSSWLAVGMIMGILDKSDPFKKGGATEPENWSMFGEAQRLAYADRDRFVADTDSAIVPVKGLLDENYLAQRATLISERAAEHVEHGDPWAFDNMLPAKTGKDATDDVAGTTHFVVVDQQGNVVSLTASVESIFGSTRMVGGMFLNNQLTDFSFRAVDEQGLPIANAVAPGKRPRSSMSPTIVLDENGEFLMATGSPGGNSIIAYTSKTLVGTLAWGLTVQQAVDLPNLVGRGDMVRIEKERASGELIDGLEAYGFKLKQSAGENSGLSVVLRNPDGSLDGGVDPRREGIIEYVQ
jgi:gamma-glutamyltranspeptidase/glutathione hydrolase